MIAGQDIFAVYRYEILRGKVVKEVGGGYQIDSEAGRKWVKFENCCTTEYGARISLDDEIEELSRNNAIGKRLCMPRGLGLDLVRDHIQNGGY